MTGGCDAPQPSRPTPPPPSNDIRPSHPLNEHRRVCRLEPGPAGAGAAGKLDVWVHVSTELQTYSVLLVSGKRFGIVLPFPQQDGGHWRRGSARFPLRAVFCAHLLCHEDPNNMTVVLNGVMRREERQQNLQALNLVLLPTSPLNSLHHIQNC